MASLKRKAALGALVAATVGALIPAAAFAASELPSTNWEGDIGSTELIVKIADLSEVHEPGVTVDFTVPTTIDFVVLGDGTLIGPSNAYIGLTPYIENRSAYQAYVSAYQMKADSGWTFCEDAATVGQATRNAVSVSIGPDDDMHNVAEGGDIPAGKAQRQVAGGSQGRKVLIKDDAWNMKAKDAPLDASRVYLETSGKLANVDRSLSGRVKLMTLDWYLTPGTRPTA